ncbi:MAG TPA: dUTP diphosphatase [Gemmataceae bacterium]|nr:dUTP diphosphatase [Gemmataceae bacterium]
MSSAELKVRRIHPLAKLPAYAHEGDAGLDLFSVEDAVIPPSRSALIKTGIQLELPSNTEAQIRPRSGLALNHQVTVLNSPGTIDRGHRGEIRVILINHGDEPFTVYAGLKIAQLVVSPVLTISVVEGVELSATDRGDGFGSSGM